MKGRCRGLIKGLRFAQLTLEIYTSRIWSMAISNDQKRKNIEKGRRRSPIPSSQKHVSTGFVNDAPSCSNSIRDMEDRRTESSAVIFN